MPLSEDAGEEFWFGKNHAQSMCSRHAFVNNMEMLILSGGEDLEDYMGETSGDYCSLHQLKIWTGDYRDLVKLWYHNNWNEIGVIVKRFFPKLSFLFLVILSKNKKTKKHFFLFHTLFHCTFSFIPSNQKCSFQSVVSFL